MLDAYAAITKVRLVLSMIYWAYCIKALSILTGYKKGVTTVIQNNSLVIKGYKFTTGILDKTGFSPQTAGGILNETTHYTFYTHGSAVLKLHNY